MKVVRNTVWIVMLLLTTTSCEKLIFEDDFSADERTTFDYLWNSCRDKYSYFRYKGISWDSVYTELSPQVENGIGNDSLFKVLTKMLNSLEDGHVNLVSDFNVSSYPFRFDANENYNDRIVEEFYLTADAYQTGPFRHNSIRNGRVAYLRYATFSGTINDEIDFIQAHYPNVDGFIIDIRSNGGGLMSNVSKLVNAFGSGEHVVYYTRNKIGAGENDFSELGGVQMGNSNGFNKKVAVLTNRTSYSASSFFTLAMKTFDNVQVFGDTTGGGLGIPNGGQLPNGWTYRFSVTQTFDTDGYIWENGVPTDVQLTLDPAAENNNTDNIIDAAADWITL